MHDDFFALGGTSISGAVLINRLQQELGEILHVVVIFDHPTVARLAAYLAAQHAGALAERLGIEVEEASASGTTAGRVEMGLLARFRATLHEPGPLPEAIARLPRNPPALFVLAPPRSGSTLLRVMLGGHPGMFAPPELELLEFDTLAERRDAFSGRDAFRLEGVLRAVMEARRCGVDEARQVVDDLEARGGTTRELYGLLQEWIGDRMLVDKTPTYAWSLETLRRAEAGFEGARYVHLLRHPYATIASFEEARIEQVFFPRAEGFTRRQLAELSWLLAQRNIREFLATIPEERRRVVRFEDLVAEPERVLRELCGFLGIAYHPDMAEPYKDRSARMTDGLHAESRMLGDVKFHQHSGVNAKAGERWRELAAEDFLGAGTRQLAAELGYEAGGEREAWAPIPRIGGAGPFPLSFGQERLWFLDRLDPGSTAYNLPAHLRLEGDLDIAALGATLNEVVRRHESLRTTFSETGAGPVQVVAPALAVAVPVIDLRALPPAAREAEAALWSAAEVERPFDLASGPLLRLLALRRGGREWSVVFNLHHIVSDGWSIGVLIREIAALYPAFRAGRPSPLPELPLQYADFTVWQRGFLAGGPALERAARLLAAAARRARPRCRSSPPTGRARPCSATTARRATQELPEASVAALRRLCQEKGSTLFMGLLAVFAALLAR